MSEPFRFHRPVRAMVTGATGQDGRFLIPMLGQAGAEVHAIVRDRASAEGAFNAGGRDRVTIHAADVSSHAFDVAGLLRELKPDYFFNLAGQSSVRESFSIPSVSWAVNAVWPARLLEALRLHSPETRLYQASSSEMFGGAIGAEEIHDENSLLCPSSPYAASKAAAHLLSYAYRRSYGLRIACGILFNHESKYRPTGFLTSKIALHLRALRAGGVGAPSSPLRVGNLNVRRDWGYAAEFARGILMIAAQIDVRSRGIGRQEADESVNYRDYVLATGTLVSVRDLLDRAFTLSGFALDWQLDGDGFGRAYFRNSRRIAVETANEYFRPGEPLAIGANARRAYEDLGWRATPSPDAFLGEMIGLVTP